jgi:hypothetical protein
VILKQKLRHEPISLNKIIDLRHDSPEVDLPFLNKLLVSRRHRLGLHDCLESLLVKQSDGDQLEDLCRLCQGLEKSLSPIHQLQCVFTG